MEIIVTEEISILELLIKAYPDSSKNTLKSWFSKGRITVDGYLYKKWDSRLKIGQKIQVGPRVDFAQDNIRILHEDSHLVVIEKPEGLLSVATTAEKWHTAHDILKRRCNHVVYPVHRLDRETSGVMVFTFTESARDGLKRDFEAHTIERNYMALVEGNVEPAKGTWKSFLAEDEFYYVKSASEGKMAITHYEVVFQKKKFCLVSFKLETGRKNQIRVHASESGHPIVGDKKYGATLPGFGRLCLHAHTLGFVHPITKKKLEFTSALPPIFKY